LEAVGNGLRAGVGVNDRAERVRVMVVVILHIVSVVRRWWLRE
jgi:hypothetical protein